MRKKKCSVNAYSTVSSRNIASLKANFPARMDINPPRKHSRFRVVVKQFAQALRGKIGLSHDAPQMLIGQRPGSVDALAGLCYFISGLAQKWHSAYAMSDSYKNWKV
jgi:hypothetical protein